MKKQTILIGGTSILLAVILFGALATYIGEVSEEREMFEITAYSETDNSTILSLTKTLSVEEGITSSEVKVYNQTWLVFDSTNEDYVKVTSDIIDSVTFWYKNETSDWIFIANVSGVTYVDGSLENPKQYPIYYSGGDYYLGKTSEITYFNGSIDDFRIYAFGLNSTMVNEIYGDRR